MSFFDRVNYAASHEDGRTELRALALGPTSRVVCVTGSGARVLDLLLDAPQEIVAVDFNPMQNRLLELKLAALRALDYDAHLGFLGITPCSDRLALYARVRSELDERARAAWDPQRKVLAKGVFYAGRWERFLRMMVTPAALARRRLIERVFACTSVEEQAELWQRAWNTPGWHRYLQVLANRTVWTKLVREPGMAHIPLSLDIVQTIRARFDGAAASYLFRDSPWAWLVFYGHLRPEGPLPPHLQRDNYELLRQRARSVTVVDGSLDECLARVQPRSVDAFSISDFGSYASAAQYETTWRGIARAAAPNARVCERQFLVPRDPSSIPELGFARERALEERLVRSDTSVVYDVVVATRL